MCLATLNDRRSRSNTCALLFVSDLEHVLPLCDQLPHAPVSAAGGVLAGKEEENHLQVNRLRQNLQEPVL